MKIATTIARVLLGLIFVVFGSNILFPFIPMPQQQPPPLAADFAKALMQSHYMTVVGVLQLVGGLLLLIGRFVPLGLTILGTIIVNILLFHILMAPEGFPPAAVVTVLELFLIWQYRSSFAPILKP